MSAIQNNQNIWSTISKESLNSKYEKCLNITEEIYKRINITFEIKKLETGSQSDLSDQSDQIDSNELSNETDLFACDKSSISSSTEPEKPPANAEKYININNNEETKLKKTVTVYKRPRKRFRKRVKKRQSKPHSDSDGSSDEAVPLSRVVELDTKCVESESGTKSGSPDKVMGVPKIIIVAKDVKSKTPSPEKKSTKKDTTEIKQQNKSTKTKSKCPESPEKPKIHADNADSQPTYCDNKTIDKSTVSLNMSMTKNDDKNASLELKNCNLCKLTFRGDRGLRRHMSMSHIINPDEEKNYTNNSKTEQREVKPA